MKEYLICALAALTFICTTAHAQIPSYLPADGLVGWWPFNGNANDESGNGNDGTVNGATLTVDRNGNANSAYYFDYYQEIQTQFNLISGSQSRSFSFWMKNSYGNKTVSPIWYGGDPNQPQVGAAFNILFNRNETLDQCGCWPDIIQGIGLGADWVYYLKQLNTGDNQWHFYVFVMNQGDTFSQVQIFIDGNLLTSGENFNYNGNASNVVNTLAINPLIFGKSWANIGYPSDVQMRAPTEYLDDIAIYNRALTEQEIQNLYTGTNTTTDTGDGAAPLPQGIPYQAAARDGNGQPVVNSPVTVRFSLHEGAADGATSYIESHSLNTNSIGLFNTVFGNGTPEQSAFDSINWAATTKFLQVEVDLGNGYVDMGTTQLLSVPYAFRSAQAANIKNAALPVYSDNAAALAGGLVAGEMYRTPAGVLMIVY